MGSASLIVGTGTATAQNGTQTAATASGQIPSAGPSQEVGDIIVTAQRRSESLQKSSLSISVLSEEAIARQGIRSTEDIAKIAPGIQIATSGPTPQIFIRGVGDPGSTAITNPAVALNIGGVYYARPQAAATAFYDLARIEVLKGPQGTLYGRNASGGAINVLPNRPELGKTGASLNIEAGNYDLIASDGAVNLPLTATSALRVSYQVRQRDGYLSDGSSDDIRQAARVQFLYQPSEGLSVALLGAYAHQGGLGNGYALYDPAGNPAGAPPRAPTAPFDPWTSATDARGAAISATRFPPPILLPGNAANLYQNNDFWNFQAEITADVGFATLTVIPAYQYAKLDYRIFGAIDFATRSDAGRGAPENAKAFSNEVRLSNESDRLKWVIGGFYYNERQRFANTLNNGLIQFTSIGARIKTESIAAFGQATLSLTDAFRVVGGLRYTDDVRTLVGVRATNIPVPGTNPNPIGGRIHSSRLDYKAGFELDLAPRHMAYGNVATGYKSGGLSIGIAPPFQPETLDSYTLGLRNRFLNGRLQFNVEAFYLKYRNQHVQVIAPDDVGIVAGLIRNAGTATSYGGEADLSLRIGRSGTLAANVTYNPTNYDSFIYQSPFAFLAPGTTGCAVTPTGVVGAAGPVGQVDCSGRDLARAPRWSGTVGYAHAFDLKSGGSLTVNGDMQFASGREGTTDYIANTRLPAYQTFNASLTYEVSGGALSVTGFVRNIGDEAVYLGGLQSTFVPSFVAMSIAPPRTYGLRLGYKF